MEKSILEKEIKVYSIKEYVEENLKNCEDKYEVLDDKLAIFESNGKGFVFDFEAVGFEFENLEEMAKIRLAKIISEENGNKGYSIGYSVELPVREILENIKNETVKVKDFFTRYDYNTRCRENFNEMIEVLKEKEMI